MSEPKTGQTWELVKTPEPKRKGYRVTVQSVVDDDWYAQLFRESRYYVREHVYLLVRDFDRYELVEEA